MKFVVSVLGGAVVALLLFTLMNYLIANKGNYQWTDDSGHIVDFIRVRQDESLNTRDRRAPERPPPPKEPPPPPQLTVAKQARPSPAPITMGMPDIDISGGIGGGPFLGIWAASDPAEGDIIPIVRIEPQYPREALLGGIEGYVKFRITIAEDGTVSDAEVLEARPGRVFTREARRAILRWKFKPRVVDGKPVVREAEQVIQFRMEEG